MMLSSVLDRENGEWVFLSWQLSLSCVMGVLAYMVFVWPGSARWGITAALSVVLLIWLIGEALMVKYVSALPSEEKEDSEEEGDKVSKSWILLRKEYHTLDEDPCESRRSRRIRRSTQSGQQGSTVASPVKVDGATSETMADSPKTVEALPDDSPKTGESSDDDPTQESEPSADDSVETTVIPMSEMQAYLRSLQDENPSGY